jgi:hypothetical protein
MDTLMRTKKLEALGFERPRAEGLVLMVKESIDEQVAKKTDLDKLESSLKLEMVGQSNMIKRVETDLKTEIKRVETELKVEIKEVRSDMKVHSRDLQLRLGGLN